MNLTIIIMKQTFINYQLHPFLKSILTLLLLSGTVAALHAQPNMNANGLFYRIEYDGDGYVDLTIPNVPGQELFFVLNGGDGGRRVVPDLCKVKGGEGATVQAAFAVGTGPGKLNPGGVIRFIPGQRGESNTGGGINGGGGGAGTGILYKAPGANITCDVPSLSLADASSCWVLLGVAGGGGGAYSGGLCGGSAGKGGNDGTQGKDGSDNGVGEDRSGSGGTNGEGGSTGQGGTGGGGYLTNGLGNNDTNAGKAGKFEGGNGDNGLQNGGFGYGGGGSGNTGGGGGGGFSGGGGGDEFAEGGGGGSFVNDAALYSEKQEGGRKNKPKSGYAEYQFRPSSTNAPKAICKTTTIEVDENGTAVIDAAQLGEGSFDPNGDQLFFCIVLPGFGPLEGSCDETLTFDCQDFGDESTWLVVVSDGESASTCRATIVVEDNDAPVITCRPTLEITLGEAVDATVTLTPNDLLTSSFDNCDITEFTLSQSTFSCSNSSDIGTHTVTLTAADNDDNFASCTTEVTINRFTVDCAPDFSATVPDGECEVWIDMPPFAGELGCGYVVRSQVCKISQDLFNPGETDVDCLSDYNTEDKSGFYGPGEYFIRWRVSRPTGGNAGLCRTDFTVEKEVPDPLDCVPDFSVTIPDGECEAWVGIPPPYNAITCGDYLESRVCVRDDLDNCPLPDGSDKSGNYGPGEYQVEWFLFQSDGAFVERCTTYFTVEDTAQPQAECQGMTVQLNNNGAATITVADIDNNSSDACGVASASLNKTSFDCTNVGTNTVILTVTDNQSNSSTCNATVTVEDKVDPQANCQGMTVQLNNNGTATITAADIDNNSSDACGIASASLNKTSFDCADVGTNTVALTVTDNNGNSSSCNATVTVEDKVDPQANCQGMTVQLNNNGAATITAADIDNNSTDACGIASTSLNKTSFDCADVGTNTVALTVTDNNGNSSSCNATVTVEDKVDPQANCQGMTVQLNNNGAATITAADIDNNSSDACGIASTSLDKTSFDCANVGMNTVALTVTDNNGNSSSCNATVTVEDKVDPQANCQGMTVQLNNNGTATITAADIDNNSSDACGIASTSLNKTSFDCANVGTNTVSLTVTDNNGNSSSCNATVTVEDQVDPQANCQGMTVQLNNNGTATITAADIDNNSSDACGIASTSLNKTSFDCANVGTNTVALTVTDNNGNSSSCNATVTVEDKVDPQANCQGMTVQLNNNGTATITAADINNNSSDACGIASTSLNKTSFDCTNVGTNTVALTVTDNNGNSSSCNATVTVEDKVDPQANCQGMTVQLNNNGTATITAADINNNSSDACGIASTSLNKTSFDCTNVGTNTVALTVTDNNGNNSSCNATVTVEDKVDPQANCQGMTVQLNNNGMASITAADIDNNSSDACGIASTSLNKTSFDCADVGMNTVPLTVTDNNGNSSSCNATVIVEDKVDPQANCQGMTIQLNNNGMASITAADIDNNSSDACGIASTSLNKTSFDCTDVGTNTVALTVTDNNGNSSSCNATVTVEDKVDPQANCQGMTVQLNNNGTATITAADINNNSSDACGIASASLDKTSFDCADVGTNTVALTVTDNHGNSSSCNATVTVEDNIDPTANCQNVTVELTPDGTAILSPGAIDNGSFDNCGIGSLSLSKTDYSCVDLGTTTSNTLTLTDLNGNMSSCTAMVTVDVQPGLPDDWGSSGIGDNGSTAPEFQFNPCTSSEPEDGMIDISSSGNNAISNTSDNVAFAYQSICGDFTMTAKVESVSSNGYGGLMVRESNDAGAKQASLFSNLTNILRNEVRYATGTPKQVSAFYKPSPIWLRMQRQGSWIFFYYSPTGTFFQYVHAVNLPMNSCVEVGTAAFSFTPGQAATATFSYVDIYGTPAPNASLPNTPVMADMHKMPELYPNPTSNIVNLVFQDPIEDGTRVILRNQLGQLIEVRQLRAEDMTTVWDVSDLTGGVYSMEIRRNGQQPQVLRFVKAQY
jgi:regulation of enolase protein 1 (concanavalin A-like superfamily)